MVADDALILLKKTPPFSFLDDEVLKNVAEEMVLEVHPKGRTIHHQSGPAAEHLSIIRSGAVKVFVRTNEGEEILVDYRTSGDFFGLLSFACGDISRDTIVATEDTSCYLIKKETVLGLLKTNTQFSEFCFRTRLKRLADMTYREIRDRTLLYGGGDKLLFTNILSDLATKKVITALEDITIQEAAEIMADHKISSLVLVDPHGLPSGIITDRDLRNKVISKGRDITARVGDIMSVTLIKSEAADYCFEALLKMIRYNIHHLLVVDKGEMKGIITNHDLMMLQGTSPLSVAREIENQNTIDGLVLVSKKINKIITILIKERARASNITRIITEINDRLLKKILEITETKLGPPPLSYCWIVYGSEGRKEQTFKTDQDNAIIYADPKGDGEEAGTYFSEFAVHMRDALARCGFPPCSADYMASNPKWRQPLSVWKKYFSNWINSPTPEAILQSLIFFDFRPVHGNVLLAEQLRAFLGHEIKDNSIFLAHMAGVVVKNRPPLDFFGKFSVEKKGIYKGKFNIKINGICPIIDVARLSALEMRVYNTSTVERLMELKEKNGTVREFCDDLEQAFEFLMSLRLRHQFQQMQEGVDPDNFINPHDYSNMEKRLLKEAFKLILSVQNSMTKKYSPWTPM
jgi:CBS domain-containing protein